MQTNWSVEDLAAELNRRLGEREAMNVARIVVEYFKSTKAIDKEDIELVLKRLLRGEPVQYVVGYTWFYGRQFEVSSAVLIPRPETEELVYWILEDWKKKGPARIIDIGTGSGCIPVTLALELERADITATDISEEALSVTQANASKHTVNVSFIKSDILQDGLHEFGKFHVIVSNPPYVSFEEFEKLDPSVKGFEPRVALGHESGDPFIFYRAIAQGAELLDGGAIYVELNEFHVEAIREIFENHGYQVEIRNDMQGKPRMLRARK
jgi:release factor glutamine methyltransferase